MQRDSLKKKRRNKKNCFRSKPKILPNLARGDQEKRSLVIFEGWTLGLQWLDVTDSVDINLLPQNWRADESCCCSRNQLNKRWLLYSCMISSSHSTGPHPEIWYLISYPGLERWPKLTRAAGRDLRRDNTARWHDFPAVDTIATNGKWTTTLALPC